MVEHDFYKLMQIPLFASISEVKKRYYELAQLYHPDKNPGNKNAEEYFKTITHGYHLLSDVDKKLVYDDLLKHYYDKKRINRQNPLSKKDLKERLFQMRERKRKDIIADFLEAENHLSHKKRLLISILIMVTGFLITYHHWYVNYLNPDMIYNFAGFMTCYFGSYLMANNIYRRDAYHNAIKLENNRVDRRAIRVFIGLFLLLPVIFFAVVTTSARIQLTYFFDYTIVQDIKASDKEFYYEYSVNRERIRRTSIKELNANTLMHRQIRVKYSRINPNISEIVILK